MNTDNQTPEPDLPTLTREFEAALRGIIASAASLPTPVRFKRLAQMIERVGAKSAADQILANPNIGDGLTNLALTGTENLVYSVEYLVQQQPWSALFTPAQLAVARRRLQ